eukprot:TRINITY_DN8970_c0_g1_i1.p1 TRINITY_DN8970_c0_g1~~TRINITY_DN8970_c0_g1_i1.p1  ORF type:complete len:206 (+),score=46.21 TRINITY_DN8970_c0_g1_i1:51-668(+)
MGAQSSVSGSRCRRWRPHTESVPACRSASAAPRRMPTDASGEKAKYLMCACKVTHNIFVKDVGMHFTYTGDDAEFVRTIGPKLPRGSPPIEEVLEEVKRQHEERKQAPEKARQRAERIQQEYDRLHPEVFKLNIEAFLAPSFRELVTAFRECGKRPPEVEACVRSFMDKNILTLMLRLLAKGMRFSFVQLPYRKMASNEKTCRRC